jgi:dipeptidyl aminopeptidase/acylaminoacyl peptidase
MRNTLWTRLSWLNRVSLGVTIIILASSGQLYPMVGIATKAALSTSDNSHKRAVTVSDMIEMNVLAPPTVEGTHFAELSVQFSPDRSKFVAVVRKGNLKTDDVDYSLLLYRTSEALRSPRPVRLLTLSSSSNRPAIQSVEWLDGRTLSLLGEKVDQSRQLYTLDIITRTLVQVTHHLTSVVSYALTPVGREVFFVAEEAGSPLFGKTVKRRGLVVTTQDVISLIVGSTAESRSYIGHLFAMNRRTGRSIPIDVQGAISTWIPSSLYLSPDGKHLILKIEAASVPDAWKAYKEATRQRFVLVDTATHVVEPLIDAPISWSAELAWAPDSASVVVANTYLPLSNAPPGEREERQLRTFVAEIKLPSREIMRITERDLMLLYWDAKTDRVIFEASGRLKIGFGIASGHTVAYHRMPKGWQEVGDSEKGDAVLGTPQIVLKQNMNAPPKLVAEDGPNGRDSTLLDLNPQFHDLTFGVVKEITWKSSDGRDIRGGLYLPPDYTQGIRYPLIIQTHGWNADEFWIGGPFSSAFAAQPLASKGFVVLQVGIGGGENAEEDFRSVGTPDEMPRELASYEGAIDYLDRAGLIVRDKVGLIGFSRTCLHVKYALTHSKYDFAAAVVADGFDGGYFQYILSPGAADDYGIYATRPFGTGLDVWIKNSPSFALDKVRAPVLIQAIRQYSVLNEWEWFSGLSKLGKAVDMNYLPDGVHELVKPWERLVSQQGTVDWLCFWLKGEEDPDPAKAEQYARWRELQHRAQREK